jgi:hypothetical protein
LTASEQIYSSAEYGFSLRYPDSLVILSEPATRLESRPPLLRRVRFQEKEIAKTEFAEREPPRFSIQVFAAPAISLRVWLDAHGRVPGRAVVTEVKREGAREGLRVRDPRLLAPNEFFYYLTPRYVIQVTPLGPEGAAMLDSLRFDR